MEDRGPNICRTLERVAREQGAATALITRHRGTWQRTDFAALQSISSRMAAGLAAGGVRAGQRVMLMVPPSVEFYGLVFALFRLGAVVILIDPGMGYRNLLRCIGAVRPEVLIAVPKALLFSRLFPGEFATVNQRIAVGPGLPFLGRSLKRMVPARKNKMGCAAGGTDLAAIIFTTGSTGPPKGVQYTHAMFNAQLDMIRDYYGIGPGEVDQPGFPLFGLFATALGATAVIPEMDPSRPARLDPACFVRSILQHRVSYSFGSPAIWNVVSRYCLAGNLQLPLKKILMAGAPVSGELLARVQRILPADAEIHTPYGATECLPLTSITGQEVLLTTWEQTRRGAGVCVGRPLPGMRVGIIRPRDGVIGSWPEVEEMAIGQIGEIVAQGPVVSRQYDQNGQETELSKIVDPGQGTFWHRMGDMGYLDERGRLWFCGRKAHRVLTPNGPLYSVCCEAVFNEHPDLARTALVGVGEPGRQCPVLIGESRARGRAAQGLLEELAVLGGKNPITEDISCFLLHPDFPVDIRHNAKIFRERLAQWAADKIKDR